MTVANRRMKRGKMHHGFLSGTAHASDTFGPPPAAAAMAGSENALWRGRIPNIAEGVLFGAFAVMLSIDSRTTTEIFSTTAVPRFALIIVVVLGLLLPIRLRSGSERVARRVFICFSLVLLYGAATTFVGDLRFDPQVVFFPLVLSFLAMAGPYRLSGLVCLDEQHAKPIMFLFSLLVTTNMALFALKFQLGDGAASHRLCTYLGGPSVVHVALLLTLTTYFACVKSRYRPQISMVLIALTIALIILTGSRAGLLSAFGLCVFMVLDMRRPARSASVLLFLATVFGGLLQILPADRFQTMEDANRSGNLETGMRILTSSTMNLIFGVGSGRVWPWYGYEHDLISYDSTSAFVPTEFGYSALTNPHSVVLGTLVELGFVGLVPLLSVFLMIFKAFRDSLRSPGGEFPSTLLMGILCTIPSFFFDYYLYKNFPLSFMWWYFVFFALRIHSRRQRTELCHRRQHTLG